VDIRQVAIDTVRQIVRRHRLRDIIVKYRGYEDALFSFKSIAYVASQLPDLPKGFRYSIDGDYEVSLYNHRWSVFLAEAGTDILCDLPLRWFFDATVRQLPKRYRRGARRMISDGFSIRLASVQVDGPGYLISRKGGLRNRSVGFVIDMLVKGEEDEEE